MKLLIRAIITSISLLIVVYLLLPSPPFPDPPAGAVQSFEPADTETPLRRAYFTNLNREEVISYYAEKYSYLPTVRLNYPPEEAQTIIRDQTRSYYLEELVHPLRTSLFINGFVPQQEKDAIIIGGEEYYQKITVRYVPSNPFVRTAVILSSLMLLYIVAKEWLEFSKDLWPKRK